MLWLIARSDTICVMSRVQAVLSESPGGYEHSLAIQLPGSKHSDLISFFLQRFQCLSSDDLAVATMVRKKDVFSFLSLSVPCVGCRRRQEFSIFM